MRWILFLLLALLLLWRFLPEPEPVEESVIAPQLRTLESAEALEAQQLEAAEARKREIDAAVGD